jgi:hypothetical protein
MTRRGRVWAGASDEMVKVVVRGGGGSWSQTNLCEEELRRRGVEVERVGESADWVASTVVLNRFKHDEIATAIKKTLLATSSTTLT